MWLARGTFTAQKEERGKKRGYVRGIRLYRVSNRKVSFLSHFYVTLHKRYRSKILDLPDTYIREYFQE